MREYLYKNGVNNKIVGTKMETILVNDHSKLIPITPNTIIIKVLKA